MQQTEHYDLKKPAVTDFYDIEDQNENAEVIDAALYDLATGKEALVKNAAEKSTPADSDGLVLVDSADSSKTKRLLWSRVKAVLKTWLDTLYATATHSHAWSAITGKPSSFTPATHTHGAITNDGKIGTAPDLPVFTGTGGAVGTKTAAEALTALGIATQAQAEAGVDNDKIMTPQRVKQAIAANEQHVLLKEITTAVSSSTVNIDLSGINWADYLQTEIYLTASFSDIPFVRVRFNGKSGDTDYKTWAGTGQGNDSAYICGTTVGDSGKGGMKITIPCNVTSVSVHCKGIGNSFSNTLGYVTAASGITFSNLNQMNLSPISGALPAGVKIAVYGVKK